MTHFIGASATQATLVAQMKSTITSHPAWSWVESATYGGSYTGDVYKCDHTASGLSADFYAMVLAGPFSAVYFGIAEGYNPATHLPKRPAMKATSALQTLQADGGVIPASTELDWYNGSIDPGGGSISVIGSSSRVDVSGAYAVVVAKDAFALIMVNSLSYVGAYDSALSAGNDPLPIWAGGSYSSFTAAAATRHPKRGGLATGWACNVNGGSSAEGPSSGAFTGKVTEANMTLQFAPGSADTADQHDSYQSDFGASRIALLNSYTSGSSTLGRYVNGWRRGWCKYVRLTQGNFSSLDTLTIDGNAYLCVTGNLWLQQDPS